jgi:hypothetical protein
MVTPLALQNTLSPTLLDGSAYADNLLLKEPIGSLHSGSDYDSMIFDQDVVEQVLLPGATPQTLLSELVDPIVQSHSIGTSNFSGFSLQVQLQDPCGIFCIPPYKAGIRSESFSVHDMVAQDASWSTSAIASVDKQAFIPWNHTKNAQNSLATKGESCRKRARSPTFPAEPKDHATHSNSYSVDKNESNLEICLYTDPKTERERKRCKGQKRTRQVKGKVRRACFGCRLYNRKVRILHTMLRCVHR